ncbi:MAG: transcription-repair coupling factor [Bacteroidota bacterium]
MKVHQLLESIKRTEPFLRCEEMVSSLKEGEQLFFENIAGSLPVCVAKLLSEQTGKKIFCVAGESIRAEKLYDDCCLLFGKENVLLIADHLHHRNSMVVNDDGNKGEVLLQLIEKQPAIVITHAAVIAQKIPQPKELKNQSLKIFLEKEAGFNTILETLEKWEFEKVDFVVAQGQYSVRGGILDIFSFVSVHPLRIEFFGDVVTSLREFDTRSQRSIRNLSEAIIYPNVFRQKENKAPSAESSSVFDYLHSDTIIMYDEPFLLEKEINECVAADEEDFFAFAEVCSSLAYFPNIIFTAIQSSRLQKKGRKCINFISIPQLSFNGSVSSLLESAQQLISQNFTVILASSSNADEKRLKELLRDMHSQKKDESEEQEESISDNFLQEIQFSSESLQNGFILQEQKIAYFTEHEIFGRMKRSKVTPHIRFRGISTKELQQLRRGDFVVHVDYGIGKFAGLTKIKNAGVEEEVAKILYKDNDVLYVNINYIQRLQKYSSKEGHTPTLTKLGGEAWEKLKSRAKKRIKDIARELIALYAKRKISEGYSFAADTTWQKEMEANFIYEDTPDQLKTTSDVKMDMEASYPMDRLICGDVGFGKTEIAVRAAFKSIQESKQVAVLVPTTILAIQHYNTFSDRLGKYAVRVENITRFKSKKEQKTILENLSDGKIDILIGTHRLLSKDVIFKDLGLLIIDEEHRFGVASKEQLRKHREQIDTLTLTATPIPRTLHFSLLGARDLSLMMTPPQNRLPIITEICQFDKVIIREAILHELSRNGQVYFVHDKVHDMETLVSRLRTYVPEARFCCAHGQMEGHELENVMLSFLEKNYDVLVSTKIIESGLDIPNVNTIFINRADHFGMAELYQLRGRVGRSNIQSYAYFLTPPFSVLPKPTIRKLLSLQEFSELGSGFHLAMRDLEIRGAGNLLGAEQSGFILEMGFELYEKIVNEAVAELRASEFENIFDEQKLQRQIKTSCIIEADFDAYIPSYYVEDDAERLDLYRRLARFENESEVEEIRNELRDRFGEFTNEVENLLLLVGLRCAVSQYGFTKIEIKKYIISIEFPDESQKAFYDGRIFQAVMHYVSNSSKNTMRFETTGKKIRLEIRYTKALSPLEKVHYVKNIFNDMVLTSV